MGTTTHTDKATPRRLLWASALVVLWLASAVVSFWWFTMKDLRPFASEVTLGTQNFDGRSTTRSLEALLAAYDGQGAAVRGTRATILHFWDSSCACSRFNESHVQQLVAQYRNAGVRLVVIDRNDPRASGIQAAFGDTAQPYRGLSLREAGAAIPASPAAAVFDGEGKLAYFGPYSEGAACLAGNGDFVEQVLDKLLAGERPSQINISAFGCFCDWETTARANA